MGANVAHRIGLALILFAQSAANAPAAPRWEAASPVAQEQNIAIAVCLPGGEIVCVGFGCHDAYGFDFVEMIVGDWLEGPTRLSAGDHTTVSTMRADEQASRTLNYPVSRGYVAESFVSSLVGHRALRIEVVGSRYAARFPLVEFARAERALAESCAGGVAEPRQPPQHGR